MKKGGSKRKGGAFERQICKELSLWWTNGTRDDVFRRSATSGGQATVRSKKGKQTFGQYGDIAIADPIGQPLISLCTIELKVGYPGQTPFDLVDSPKKQQPVYKKFFEQCIKEKQEAKTPYWILIARRKQKETMIYLPHYFYRRLKEKSYIDDTFPQIQMSVQIKNRRMQIFGCLLCQFFLTVGRKSIENILKDFQEDHNASSK